MQVRRKALLALAAVLLALLSPTATSHLGTPGARVVAAVPDAVPAARLTSRDSHQSAPALDATTGFCTPQPIAVASRAERLPAPVPPYRGLTARRIRGPPQV